MRSIQRAKGHAARILGALLHVAEGDLDHQLGLHVQDVALATVHSRRHWWDIRAVARADLMRAGSFETVLFASDEGGIPVNLLILTFLYKLD